jgi:uncharacterized repeat protein (TIGR01451 family)
LLAAVATLGATAGPAQAATSGHHASIQPRVVGGIVNGTFETGALTGWTQLGMTHAVTGGAHSGTYSAELGSSAASHTSSISQTFTEPVGTPSLSFWYNVALCFKFILGTLADYATATLTDNTTSTTTTPLAKTCPAIATGWQQISVPVIAGHSYTLALIMFTSSSDGSRLRFDDIGAVGLAINKSADKASVNQGGTVLYTVTVTNAGQFDYTGAAFSDSLSGALDDAVYNSDAAATAGTVGYTSPNLTWTGDLAVGASATITYSMTVMNLDVGDLAVTDTITSATAANNCFAGNTDPNCSVTVTVAVSAVVDHRADQRVSGQQWPGPIVQRSARRGHRHRPPRAEQLGVDDERIRHGVHDRRRHDTRDDRQNQYLLLVRPRHSLRRHRDPHPRSGQRRRRSDAHHHENRLQFGERHRGHKRLVDSHARGEYPVRRRSRNLYGHPQPLRGLIHAARRARGWGAAAAFSEEPS